ncbi:MAG TPA: hypothetical protein VLL54_01660 [Pyrinomonadaceae bacterium]|nr:hypothetical protein [Pyrinomonadaceae bacterium]
MSVDLTNLNVGPRELADGFLVSTEQWLSLQVGMARIIYGKRLGIDEDTYQAAAGIAREWLVNDSPNSLSLVRDIRGYGAAHTQKFADDSSAGNVDQLRRDLTDLHGMASGIQTRAQALFQRLGPLAQSCAALKERLLEHQMWAYDLDEHLGELQYMIEKLEGVWGALASDLQNLADRTANVDQLSAIMIKVRDKSVLRAWESIVSEADGFLVNSMQIPTKQSFFTQGFGDREGGHHSAGLGGAVETDLQLGYGTPWYLVPCDDGFFYIFAQDSWRCLAADKDSNTGFLYPTLRTADGVDAEKWQLVSLPNGQLLIASKVNGLCLASQSDGEGNANLMTTQLVDRSQAIPFNDRGLNVTWNLGSG